MVLGPSHIVQNLRHIKWMSVDRFPTEAISS